MVESTATPGTSAAALTFTFSAHTLRVIMRNGNPWFVASDVCEAIGIKNYRDSVERLDADEKGVGISDTLGGAQEMLIVNESGLNAIILRSHGAMTPGTPSHKYRKWVTAEVLPAIRKTGRYVAPNAPQATTAPPTHTAERLSGSDMLNIKRMIWFCTRSFRHETAWVQGIWFYLRRVLAVPSPQPLTVDHLPALAAELHHIHAVAYQVQDIIRDIEAQAVKRIFRKGESADVVLADLKRLAAAGLLELQDDVAKLPSYLHGEHVALVQRRANPGYTDYGTNEQPGYFSQNTQGAAA